MTDDTETEPCPPPSADDDQEMKRLGTWAECPSCEELFVEGPDICPFCGRHLP